MKISAIALCMAAVVDAKKNPNRKKFLRDTQEGNAKALNEEVGFWDRLFEKAGQPFEDVGFGKSEPPSETTKQIEKLRALSQEWRENAEDADFWNRELAGHTSMNDGDGTCPGYSDDDRNEKIFNILTDVSDENDLNDLDTSHGKALVWILSKDNRELCPDDETLVQRYILAELYFNIDGDKWTECSQNDNNCNRNGEAWLSGTSECDWFGITCNQKGCVDTIELDFPTIFPK